MDKYIIGIGTKKIIPAISGSFHYAGIVEFVKKENQEGKIIPSELPFALSEVWGKDQNDALKKLRQTISKQMPNDVKLEFSE